MSTATVQHGLEQYGATMRLEQVLEVMNFSERTLRDRIAAGSFPKSIARGVYPTEQVMLAACGKYQENYRDSNHSSPAVSDPFS